MLQHSGRLSDSAEGSRIRAIELLAVLLLHHHSTVRRTATAVVTSPQLRPWITAVLEALQSWLRTGPPRSILVDSTSEDPVISDYATAQRYHRAVASLAAVSKGDDLSPQFLGRLLQIAVHPNVAVGGMSYRGSWQSVCRLGFLL